MLHKAIIKAYTQKLYAKGKHEEIVMNNIKKKIIHIIFKMIQTQTLREQEYQQRHMEDGKTIPGKDWIGATKAAPMINQTFKTSSSVFIECTLLKDKHSFEEKQKKYKFFLTLSKTCNGYLRLVITPNLPNIPYTTNTHSRNRKGISRTTKYTRRIVM